MKTLGLISVGYVLGSLIGMSWMGVAIFLGVIIAYRSFLEFHVMVPTPPEVWVAEPSDNPGLVPNEDSAPLTQGPVKAARHYVELVGTADSRGRPKQAVVLGVDREKNLVTVAPVIQIAGEAKEMTLALSYVRQVRAVAIR